MASSIGQITAPLSAASQAASAGAIFHTIIDAPKTTYGTLKAPEVSADGDIVLENVNFVYPTRPDVKVLEGLNLCFPAGKVTAIVGPSGSGKSTIVGILERWYEFNGDPVTNQLVRCNRNPPWYASWLTSQVLWLRNGLVTVGGHKLSDIDPKWWRNQIGLVQQDNALFNTTIYKNVEHGLIGTEWECEVDHVKAQLVEEACRDAFADEFIARLPDVRFLACSQASVPLTKMLTSPGLPNSRWRVWHQAQRWPAPAPCYRARHCQEAQGSHPRRGNILHRCAQRANCPSGPRPGLQRTHDDCHRTSSRHHQEGA